METITLKQAIEQAVERGQKISFGTFQTFEDFASYYEAHYLPMLQDLFDTLEKGVYFDRQEDLEKKRLVGFLIEDLNAITEQKQAV